MGHKKDCDSWWLPVACDCEKTVNPMEELSKQLVAQILDFDCPECAKLDKCIDSLECRLYKAGREDAANLVSKVLAEQLNGSGL